ncbi:hypothetical protein OROMI_015430 [Orobanche minor]
MSMGLTNEPVSYVNCNYCNTILAVNVPQGNMFTILAVRCGHCANLFSVNMGASLQSVQLQDLQLPKTQSIMAEIATIKEDGSSSKCSKFGPIHTDYEQPKMPPVRRKLYFRKVLRYMHRYYTYAPEKRPRVPSAYNRFIKEEIQRIKVSNPEISHREAFSTAAKNWAHFPHIHFGPKLDGNKEAKVDHSIAGKGVHKSPDF